MTNLIVTLCGFANAPRKLKLFILYCNKTTDYGLDGPGIESRCGRDFSAPVQTGPEAHPASCTMGTGSFHGGKVRPGRDADPSPPSSVEVKNRVELYLYSPQVPSWPVKG